ncbi:MAG: PAS domain S-box protein [Saprospiraceae bacterium]
MKVENKILPAFLAGGGHMGALIRSYDWSKTSVGSPDTWPQSLRIAVRIMLDCPFGMYIAWGNEYIQLYNDGYRPILGATKHPQALGISTRKTFEEIWTTIGPMFEGVMEGTPVGFPDFILHLDRNGFLEECVFDFSYSPIRLENGEVAGVLVTVIETTEKVKAVKALKESLTEVSLAKLVIQKNEENLKNTISRAPVAMCLFKGENFIVDLANDRMFELWGKPASEVLNKPIFEGLTEAKDQGFEAILQEVYTTGKTYSADRVPINLQRNGVVELVYVNFVYAPFIEADGIISGIMAVAIDVTAQVTASKKIEDSEHRFRFVLEQSLDPILILKGENMVLEIANEPLFKIWGVDKNALGKPFLEILPEMKEQGFFDMLQDVYFNDKIIKGIETPVLFNRSDGTKETIYFNFTYQPYREEDGKISGVLVVASDVTRQVVSKKQIEESEAKFRMLSGSIPHMIWTATPDGNKNFFNQYFLDYTGLAFEELKGHGWYAIIFPDDLERELVQWHRNIKTGEDFKIEKRVRHHDGSYRWHLSHGIAQKDEQGSIIGWIGSSTEIEEQKKFTEELEIEVEKRTEQLQLQNQTFELAERIAQFGSYRWNISTGALEYSDNLFRLLDCEPKEFIPSFEKFLSFIHPDDLQQVITNGEQTMQTGVLVETPYRIISKTGKIKHLRSSGNFTGEYNNLILIGTVQDVSKDVAAAEELRTKNLELELTNAELASFNYIASHDLKEPLRKIQTFSKLILQRDNFSDKTQDYFNRIIAAAERMQNLIESLLDFSSVNTAEPLFEPCDLNVIVTESEIDLEEKILESQAIIEHENLPVINGARVQIAQLFTNLIDNAIKYSRSEAKPHIKITSSIVEGKIIEHPSANSQKEYHAIEIADNGIGFEKEYANKIFELFQRLHHKNEYSGTGIGLAIAKKIVTNHNGFIIAEGKPNIGSKFTIYIPTA